jgi:hypothetical protein
MTLNLPAPRSLPILIYSDERTTPCRKLDAIMVFHNSKKIRLAGSKSLHHVESTHIQATWKFFKPHGTRYAKENGAG